MASFWSDLTLIVSVAVVIIWIVRTRRNAWRFRRRLQVNGKAVVKDFLLMERKNRKTKTPYLVSVPWQKKITFYEMPPAECIDIDERGRKVFEANMLGEDDYVFMKNKGIVLPMVSEGRGKGMSKEYAQCIKDTGVSPVDVLESTGKSVAESFIPFSLTARSTLVGQYERAEEDRKRDWKRPEVILPFATVSMLGMIIIAGLIFVPDVLTAWSSANSEAAGQVYKNLAVVSEQNVRVATALGIEIERLQDQAAATAASSPGEGLRAEVDAFIGELGP